MLKSRTLRLSGRDAAAPVVITELPALVADRHARAALAAIGESPDGGVVAVAFAHMPAILALGARAADLLEPFVQTDRPLRDWRSVLTVQQAALTLHAGFLVGRPRLEIPVAMQAESIKRGTPDAAVSFCSPTLAAVLHSGRATYRELETVLSTEDAYNLVELVNVERIHEWHAHQTARTSNP